SLNKQLSAAAEGPTTGQVSTRLRPTREESQKHQPMHTPKATKVTADQRRPQSLPITPPTATLACASSMLPRAQPFDPSTSFDYPPFDNLNCSPPYTAFQFGGESLQQPLA